MPWRAASDSVNPFSFPDYDDTSTMSVSRIGSQRSGAFNDAVQVFECLGAVTCNMNGSG
jgi:hypothetical protein